MKRLTLATSFLIASAFVLGALLTVEIAQKMESPAHAEMVVNKDLYTVLTAPGIGGSDFLYMLDNKNERLLCYRSDPRGRVELYAALNVTESIKQGLAAWEKSRGGR